MSVEELNSSCKNCGEKIYYGQYRQHGGWEPDYNPHDDPTTWRHINGYAGCLKNSFAEPSNSPKIVCLCGSSRFYDAFQQANYDKTMAGEIVLSIGFYPHSKAEYGHGEGVGHDSDEKIALDELHKRKIDLCDYVYVLNVDGYVGDSTKSEMEYAKKLRKSIEYLEAIDV